MYPRNSKRRRGGSLSDEGKGKKTATRQHSEMTSSSPSGKEGPSGSQSASNRKVAKSKTTRAKVDSDSDSKFQRCTPLASSSGASPSNHSSSSSSTDAGSSFSPPHFAPGHTLHLSNNHSPTSYYSTTGNPTLPSTYVSDNRGHVDWPLIDATTRFSSPHSPIASLAPHSTHTLPFTALRRGNNEDISVNDNSSLPYYYPPEWNRDVPEWNRIDPPEWSRADFMNNPVGNGTMPPSYSMGATNQSPGPSPSLLSSWDEPLDVDLGRNSQANDVSTVPTLTPSASVTTSANDRTNSDPPLFEAIPTNNDTGDVRMTQNRRESIGQHRRRGVSYSNDEHQSILQELLSPQPGTSTPYSSFSPRPYGPLSSNRFTTIRLGQSSARFTPDVLSDDYTTRRRSARVCPGRSRLDALQHRPVHNDLSSTSSTLLESDNSPVLPLEDIAGILSDLERNGSERPTQELPSDSRGDVTPDDLSAPTTNTAGISPINISDSRGDVITISSDEESEVVHVETRRPPRRNRQQDVSDDGDVGPSTTQIERDEEYARRLQEELYHEASRPHDRPEQAGSIPVYPPNLHPWSPGVYFIPNMETLNHSASRYMRSNRDTLAAGIQNWNEGGARRFLARALSSRRRGQRRPTSRNAIMSHISHLPPALFLSSLLGTPLSDGLDYEQLLELADRLGSAKSQGLKKEDIEKLTTRVYKGKGSSDSSSCVVCMSDYEAGDKLRVLLCSHEYHVECIDQWLKENRTCPICRLDTKLLSNN